MAMVPPGRARGRRRRRPGDEPGAEGDVAPGTCPLCVLAVEDYTTKARWVLDDYADHRRSWQLKKIIGQLGMKHRWRHHLWREFSMDTQVEVVQGVEEGDEVFVHDHRRVDAYNFRRGRWRGPNDVSRSVVGKVHVLLLRHEVIFRSALHVLSRSRSLHAWGQCCCPL
ncbi:hypothetical protein E2562_012805 [Oryza meyeriana var. granulata]|uniref:Uncharacterized protein n=1 Tax=Oryza meyeriana var. granulata TaxID=110450 RepID=A0A6G1DHU4_9ORYZ|nr:hypothetical protein E2562_012805 [Oryza meyeriana var. granulata]